jgi:hypothetical protein
MSKKEVVLHNTQQTVINTEFRKIFIWNNRFEPAEYTNEGTELVTLESGTLLGRDDSGKVVPLSSAATDGSQFPVGILNEEKEVEAGATVNLFMCVSGDVDAEGIVLQGTDTLNTRIEGRTIRDRIGSDTVGIKLIGSTDELTNFNNSEF